MHVHTHTHTHTHTRTLAHTHVHTHSLPPPPPLHTHNLPARLSTESPLNESPVLCRSGAYVSVCLKTTSTLVRGVAPPLSPSLSSSSHHHHHHHQSFHLCSFPSIVVGDFPRPLLFNLPFSSQLRFPVFVKIHSLAKETGVFRQQNESPDKSLLQTYERR